MTRLGIGDDTTVIAYDDTGGMTAARLVVMLRMLGLDAALLDGGLAAWTGELTTGAGAAREPRHFTARSWPVERLASVDEIALAAARGSASPGMVLTDARPSGRYNGEITAVDPRPGHIPGAVNAPWSAVVDPATTKLLPIPELRAHFA
ncbi:MAG TPA: rhodanese-like domain-containing protein, partial [Ilumatobacteraceae bacterium]|nr:rhodanese-like domain-containing protein [Ilumatobacteraceae bacterium]